MYLYYLAFALATSATTLIWYYLPAVRQATSEGVRNATTEHPVLGATVYFVITAIMAPFVVPTLLSTTRGERFREGLYKAICKPDE